VLGLSRAFLPPKHKFACKFRRAINAMAIDTKDWMSVEQAMEEQNHILLQTEITDQDKQQQPQLLMISSHGAQGTSSAATFSVLVTIGGIKGLALVDSGSTNTFMEYTFASKINCSITATSSQWVKIAGGGHLDSSAKIDAISYFIQNEAFANEFKLLQLKDYGSILGCDWIKLHGTIGLDLRDNSRQLSILKDGQKKVIFKDFTAPHSASPINASKMQKMCKTDITSYIIQINSMSDQEQHTLPPPELHNVSAILQQFEDIFFDHMAMPPARECDHRIPLKEGSKPPNIRPYRIPYKQKDEVETDTKYAEGFNHKTYLKSLFIPSHIGEKKDGSWCLCIDYRELNAQVVKNKFLVSVIEDPLDELCGAKVFTKLDLRSGYHQIRMKENYIHNIAFRT
jgi:hypothetical protein